MSDGARADRVPLRVQLVSCDLAWADPDQNLCTIEIWVRKLKGESDLIVFPELTLTGFVTDHPEACALDSEDPRVRRVRELARESGVALVFGYPLRGAKGSRPENVIEFVDSHGAMVARYSKLHLFVRGTHPESKTYTPGTAPVMLKWKGWTLGFGICFDLRFPALFGYYARHGVDLLLLPACWVGGPTKADQFATLARAHAILGQAYFCAVNRTGSDPFAEYEGDRVGSGPFGEQPESRVTEWEGGLATEFHLMPDQIHRARTWPLQAVTRTFTE